MSHTITTWVGCTSTSIASGGRIPSSRQPSSFAPTAIARTEGEWTDRHDSMHATSKKGPLIGDHDRLALIYLSIAGLILGIYPERPLLAHFGLSGVLTPLIEALKVGNIYATIALLNQHKAWHLRHGTYLLLREKLPVQLWRNLFRQT